MQGICEGTAAGGERWIAVLQLELRCLMGSCSAWGGGLNHSSLAVRGFFKKKFIYLLFLYILHVYIYTHKIQADYSCLLGAEGL